MTVLDPLGEPLLCPKCRLNVRLIASDPVFYVCEGKCHAAMTMKGWQKWEQAYRDGLTPDEQAAVALVRLEAALKRMSER